MERPRRSSRTSSSTKREGSTLPSERRRTRYWAVPASSLRTASTSNPRAHRRSNRERTSIRVPGRIRGHGTQQIMSGTHRVRDEAVNGNFPAVTYPTLRLERRCWEAGDRVVVGIDEVGRGAWAGPVTVAAVVSAPEHVKGIRDSKMLTRPEREQAAGTVRGWARAIGVGHASYEECDALGMTLALRA